jgi:stage II sporulation protein D
MVAMTAIIRVTIGEAYRFLNRTNVRFAPHADLWQGVGSFDRRFKPLDGEPMKGPMRGALRHLLPLTLLALTMLLVAAASASARSSVQYRIEGRGWGHGIGMSQYGADGYAKQGWTVEQIIPHYFTGTVIAPRPADGPASLRVLLQSYLSPARIQMTSDGIVQQGAASLPLAAGDIVAMTARNGRVIVTRTRAGAPAATLIGGGSADPTIVPAVDGGARILFKADHARPGTAFRGTLSGHVFEGQVSVYNTVAFESYVRGVVGDEMPPSWHPEALKAQAIAARSYALRSLRTSYNWFDVYSDTRSQVYGGIGAEEASTDAAVAATANQVARVGDANGEVAQTFFFSTSAGRTAGNEEVWRSSPYFFWKGSDILRLTPAQLGARLGYSSGFRSASVSLEPSGYVKDVVARTTSGTRTISGSSVQAKLGLRSSYFRLQYLSLTAPAVQRDGSYVKLSGRIPRYGKTFLTLRRGGVSKTVVLKPTNAQGDWVVRTRMSGNLLLTMSRTGLGGPRMFVPSTATAQGKLRLAAIRRAARR